MRIPINLPQGPPQKLFLEHFNAQHRDRMQDSHGTAAVLPDGGFKSEVTGKFRFEEGEVELQWSYEKSPDGTLVYIEAKHVGSLTAEIEWERLAQDLVMSSMAATIAAKRSKYFRSNLFYYVGQQLDGEYWFKGVRFAPALPEDEEPHVINAERVVVIDQEVEAIDSRQATAIAKEQSSQLAARFSVFLNEGLYRTAHEMRWVYPSGTNSFANATTRQQLGFNRHTTLERMPDKGSLCGLGRWKRNLREPYRGGGEQLLSFPSETRKILGAIDGASRVVSKAFDRSARLYQLGLILQRQFPSAALAYHVAAIEALSEADEDARKFSAFVRKYADYADVEVDQILDYLYGDVRSAHFHAGEFALGEFDRDIFPDSFMSSEYVERSNLLLRGSALTYSAMSNWLLSRISCLA